MPLSFAPTLPKTVQPVCPYFGVCGGCDCQDVSYKDQLEAKHNWLADLFAPLQPTTILPILGSPQEYPVFFRNKIRFGFIEHGGTVWPSRHKKGEEAADIPADHCYLQSEEANKVIRFIARCAHEFHWTLYDPKRESGWLKHILIRQGKWTGEVMVSLVTDALPIPAEDEFIIAVQKELPFVSSLYQTQSWGKSLEKLEDRLLYGTERIHEQIGEYTFAISPQAFFQTNSEMVETLYRATAQLAGTGTQLWDLYAGSATIGLFLHKNFDQVLSIEINESNIADAKINCVLNKVTNLTIIPGAVEEVLTSTFLQSHVSPNCIVVDPPRAGLHQRLRTLLPYLKAQRIVYVSCNPFTCLRDCTELTRQGYRLTTLQPIDMFPHSWHAEMIAVLERS